MIVYIDKYYYNSRSASALLLKDRIKRDNPENYLVFSTNSVYKGTHEKDKEDAKVITRYLFEFRNVFLLYLGFFVFMLKNGSKVTRIISFSSPGYNLLFHGFSFWASKVSYTIQDVFPEGLMLIFPKLKWTKYLWSPLIGLAYRRLDSLETISVDMRDYIARSYNVDVQIRFNTNPYSDISLRPDRPLERIPEKVKIGYSGNLSNAHGFNGPVKLITALSRFSFTDVHIRGFGKYFDSMKNLKAIADKAHFGGSMDAEEYKRYLKSLDVILLFQDDGYEKVCLSCKFNTVIELGKPIIYIGPESDISRYLRKQGIGLCLKTSCTIETIEAELKSFFENLPKYSEAAITNEEFNLNEVLC